MIGRNTLSLNQATAMAAVQMYLDSERKPDAAKLKVTSIKQTQCHPCVNFEVEFESDEKP